MTTPNNPNIPFGFCQCGCGQKTKIAPTTRKSRGEIRGQPKRHLKGHWTPTAENCFNMQRHGHCVKGQWSGVYRTWAAMMGRCYCPSNSCYRKYGARGITVCDRWHDFKLFALDMGDRPKGMSIDRINNDLGYSPENCRWATAKEQVANRRIMKKHEVQS